MSGTQERGNLVHTGYCGATPRLDTHAVNRYIKNSHGAYILHDRSES